MQVRSFRNPTNITLPKLFHRGLNITNQMVMAPEPTHTTLESLNLLSTGVTNHTEGQPNRTAGLYSPLPLNYIRLLRLQPGQWSDPIRCSLVIVNFDAASPTPSYEAVSYTWGNASVQKKVICNDQSMQVTRSLFDALQVFREPHADRMLWVDALCINQGDVIERNSQVQLMNRIYSGASSVAVWLGHDRPDAIRMALNMLCLSAKEHWKTHEEFDPASGSLIVQSPQYYVRIPK